MRNGVFLLFCILVSCNNSVQRSTEKAPEKQEVVNVSVFPVTAYLRGQVKEIENSPVTLLKIVEKNGRLDSAWVGRENLDSFIGPFLITPIDSAHSSAYFSSGSFYDDEEDQYILEYKANDNRPSDVFLRQIMVYINAATNEVSDIYIEKEEGNIKSQLIWKTGGSCTIHTIYLKDDQEPVVEKEKLVWNF